MAFKFRFQAILNYRRLLLNKAQNDLAAAMRKREMTKQRMDQLLHERLQCRFTLEQRQRRGIPVQEYIVFQNYLSELERQLDELEIELKKCTEDVEKTKKRLLRRETELKMMELIEAKDHSAYRKEKAKRESLKLDEMIIMSIPNRASGRPDILGGPVKGVDR